MNLEKRFWKSVHGRVRKEGPVSSFHMFVPPDDLKIVWKKVELLTAAHILDYLSSICDKPMTFGRWAGSTCISVHFSKSERRRVKNYLRLFNLFQYVEKEDDYRSNPKPDMVERKRAVIYRDYSNLKKPIKKEESDEESEIEEVEEENEETEEMDISEEEEEENVDEGFNEDSETNEPSDEEKDYDHDHNKKKYKYSRKSLEYEIKRLKRDENVKRKLDKQERRKDHIKLWTKVDQLTEKGQLGYMSSVPAETMTENQAKKDVVYKGLQKFSLEHFIHKYSNYRREPQQDMLPNIAKNEVLYDAVTDDDDKKRMREDEVYGDENEQGESQVNNIDEDKYLNKDEN